jgi:hypothetical protein
LAGVLCSVAGIVRISVFPTMRGIPSAILLTFKREWRGMAETAGFRIADEGHFNGNVVFTSREAGMNGSGPLAVRAPDFPDRC